MTRIGDVNRNQQELLRTTNHAGVELIESFWVLRCKLCGYEYISNRNGFDERRCPAVSCQKGPVGLAAPFYRSARA
jgi:hypothetical protein